ncbi:MAG: SAM-dependent methyltransferase, partial [Trichodesmium sp. St19_bin1]|nr:SAM-dependent methyltransferase [Trichodesmium sp. St19_bin1]
MSNSIKEFRKFEYNAWQKSGAQYDNSFASLTNQMIKPLLNAVNAKTGVKILDIATGPGYVAADAA